MLTKEPIKLQGFSRVQIEEDGKIVGDSGWTGPNTVTNLGFRDFLVCALGSSNTSSYIGYVALGTGTQAAAADVTLAGEIMSSTSKTAVTFAKVASHTAQFTATFASANSFITGASSAISNIGLFKSSEATNTLFASNTYASSACSTNQNVNITYQIRFS